MNIVACITICFVPLIAVFACIMILNKDFELLSGILALVLGLVAAAVASFIQLGFNILNSVVSLPIFSLVVIILYGFIEEAVKAGLMFFYNAKKNSLKNFIAYGAVLAMSFGCLESLIYFINEGSDPVERLVTSVLIHIGCTILASIFVYSLKNKKCTVLPLILSVLCHGFYNYFVIQNPPLHFFFIPVLAFTFIEVRVRYLSYVNSCDEEIINKGVEIYEKTLDREISPKEEEQNIQDCAVEETVSDVTTTEEEKVPEIEETVTETSLSPDDTAVTEEVKEEATVEIASDTEEVAEETSLEETSDEKSDDSAVEKTEDNVITVENNAEPEANSITEEELTLLQSETSGVSVGEEINPITEEHSDSSPEERDEDSAEESVEEEKPKRKTTASKKTTAKKSTASKATASKTSATKKASTKTATKKTSSTKAATGKTTSAKKTSAKSESKAESKSTGSKTTAKKTSSTKTAASKTSGAKKTTSTKTASKSTAAKASTAKKSTAKAASKTSTTKKTSSKAESKTTASKKTAKK